VIVEIGLAVVLVVVTGMFARAFAELDHLEWGFDPARVRTVDPTVTTEVLLGPLNDPSSGTMAATSGLRARSRASSSVPAGM
jgi:hypothetical protein